MLKTTEPPDKLALRVSGADNDKIVSGRDMGLEKNLFKSKKSKNIKSIILSKVQVTRKRNFLISNAKKVFQRLK